MVPNRPLGAPGGVPDDAATPDPPAAGDSENWVVTADSENGYEATDAFQALASDTRVAVLVHLLRAARDGDLPQTFSELQAAVGSDSSAGFAYHLRQLDGRFVERRDEGYVLTDAGERAARAVVSGAFTGDDRQSAS
jgi:hypothetical protein